MVKLNKLHQKTNSRFHCKSNNNNKNKLSPHHKKVSKDANKPQKVELISDKKKEWENAVCSVCMESPHNAVLLLCSSHEKNCRPYMCATDPYLSNCLDQYKKPPGPLLCPLCRGEVKGWAVVEPARKYLDLKKRACLRESCSFVGNYREIKKHVEKEHPFVCPREVDPTHAEKWKRFEERRDISDVVSAIRSTMPGAIVIGDYVVENGFYSGGGDGFYSGRDDGFFGWSGPAFTLGSSRSTRRRVSRMARLHERLLFGRRMGRLGR